MKKILFIFLFFTSFFSSAQKQGNIWYFGDSAGLDFNNGIPLVLTNGATYVLSPFEPSEGTSVISDSSGSLLFYTNGQQIWNRNHQIMPNGDSILGHWSSTQAALIVAQPSSSRYFYVFTTDAFYNNNLKYGFRYSIVDICLDNGLGDVDPSQKNIKLLDTVAEKLTAVRHTNGVDYWVIIHKYYSDAFYAYHLSSSGIVDTVISHIGSVHPVGMVGIGAAIGQLKASPNGQKLAIVNGQSGSNINVAEYFDFNKTTGVVSNCVSIQTTPVHSYYGVSFSPNNSKLYISCWLNNNGIYQFDLNAGGGNPDSVRASKTTISNVTHYGMQLGVDGKIYLVKAGNPNTYLSVINNPNNSGTNCNYQDSAIYLNGKTVSLGLPNFIDSYDYSNATHTCQSEVQEQNQTSQVNISPNPFNSTATFEIKDLEFTMKDLQFQMYDVFGKKVKSFQFKSQKFDIERGNLPSGIYFYKISDSTEVIGAGKVVIQ